LENEEEEEEPAKKVKRRGRDFSINPQIRAWVNEFSLFLQRGGRRSGILPEW